MIDIPCRLNGEQDPQEKATWPTFRILLIPKKISIHILHVFFENHFGTNSQDEMTAVGAPVGTPINILDPNLGQTHPALVPWVQNMRNQGFTNQQIQFHFQQQMQRQSMMQSVPSAQGTVIQYYQQPMVPQQQSNVQWMQQVPHQPIFTTATVPTIQSTPNHTNHSNHSNHNGFAEGQNQTHSNTNNGNNGTMPMLEEDSSTPYYREIEELKRKNAALEKRLSMMQTADKLVLETLTLDELDQAKANHRERIRLIEEAEKQYIDSNYRCVACMHRKRTVVFVDGCDHQAFCEQCESTLETKVCPICQTSYTETRTLI